MLSLSDSPITSDILKPLLLPQTHRNAMPRLVREIPKRKQPLPLQKPILAPDTPVQEYEGTKYVRDKRTSM
jgi:hypothetical protein